MRFWGAGIGMAGGSAAGMAVNVAVNGARYWASGLWTISAAGIFVGVLIIVVDWRMHR